MNLIVTVITVMVTGLLTSCEKHCFTAGGQDSNKNYYDEKSTNKYLLTEDAVQKIFLVASSNNPSENDTSGYIKSFKFQHITATNDYKPSEYANVKVDASYYNKYSYETTDYFYVDSLSKKDSAVIWYYGWRDFIDTASGKFVNTYRGLDSTQVEFNATGELCGSQPIFGIYINKDYKEILLSRVTPKVIVYNPQKISDLKALARAYNQYMYKNFEGGIGLFYEHGYY